MLYFMLCTYYNTFICLNAYLNFKMNNYDRNLHEARGRIFFYIVKCKQDIYLIKTIRLVRLKQ